MPELRWILTAIGVILIIGVYVWSRRDRGGDDGPSRRREPGLVKRPEPWNGPFPKDDKLPEPDAEMDGTGVPTDRSPQDPDAPELPPEGEQLIVALRLRARQPDGFDGSELVKAFSAEGLEYGKFGAFHSLDERRRSRFLVASLVEPGSFEIEKMHELRCPGVSMFMVLPGPREPLSALDGMFTCARRLAERLDAEVLDDKGNALTMQQAGWLREQVVEYHRRSKLGTGLSGGRPGDLP
ncbi:MAG TPA: cell division protein ZipA C-terminal FtsZ-binding domain-containing protein [Gammaproteobacteria bacterium]|nr:cell division protein ZipA C-terminal FtsZ-binding domain-containing protein [Gammaproteobacteria bacterium]